MAPRDPKTERGRKAKAREEQTARGGLTERRTDMRHVDEHGRTIGWQS